MGWSKSGWVSDGWGKVAAVAAGYIGPVDAVPGASHYWGLRAATSALIGQNAVRPRRDSDNTFQPIETIAGGGLNLALATSFKGGANLFSQTVYDQIGTDNFVQGTSGDQPEFNLGVTGPGNSLPVISGGAAGRYLEVALAGGAISQPFTMCAVVRRTTGTASAFFMGGSATGVFFENVSGRIRATAGTGVNVEGNTENQFHSVNIVFNGGSSNFSVDGANNPVALGAGTLGATIGYLAWSGQGSAANVEMLEQIIYPTALSAGDLATISANQHSYWGY